MFKFLAKVEANVADARLIGPSFVVRHLKPWAPRHSFRYAGKPVMFRRGSSDTQVIRYLLVHGEYRLQPEALATVKARYSQILAAGKTPVIIDAGGNIGLTAVWLANDYPQAVIVSIEPDPDNFAILRENVSHWANIVPLNCALGGEPGRASLSGDDAWAMQTTRSDDGETEVVTIRQAQGRAGNDTELLMVKIDIEGFELEVFDGDASWLDELVCLMIEPHDWLRPQDHTSRSFQREVGTRPFNLYICQNNLIYVRDS